ncbi:MAG: ArnT family glycosyltransferase [Phycisphaerales bacterium]
MQGKGWLWLTGLFIAAVGLRVVAPSDLYDNDQPKTVAYTVDMVRHGGGHWALPVDMLGRPATKPPMFNWISAPFVTMFGANEVTLKLPAILAGGCCVLLIVWAGRGIQGSGFGVQMGVVAACLFLASTIGMKLIYLARPDGVLAAFMIGAWWFGTVGLKKSARPHAVVGFWLCIAGAALSKGPVAVIPLIYVVLAAKLIEGEWRAALRLRWSWGLPLMLLVVGGWIAAAYTANPAGFTDGLIGDMMRSGSRGDRGIWLGVLNSIWKMPVQFVARFLPWSVFVIAWLLQVSPRRWFRHELGPAVLWVLLIVGLFALSPRHRPDYLAPAFGPAALIAAAWLLETGGEFGLSVRRIRLACAAIVLGLGAYYLYCNSAAKTQYGEHTRQFVLAVKRTIGDQRVTCINTGYNPLQPLLGVNDPPGVMSGWLIRPVDDGDQPMLRSKPLPEVHDGRPGELGLFRR